MFLFFLQLFLGSSLIYDEEVSGEKTEIVWLVKQSQKAVELLSKLPERVTSIVCDPDFHPMEYAYKDPSKKEELTITRSGKTLNIIKTGQDFKKEKSYSMKTSNWVQDFSFGLKPFFMSNLLDWKFDIINPKDLSMRTMVASKLEMEYKTFHGIKYRAQRVKVTLDGYLRKFWKADIWYDTETHNLLYYKANEGPSTPYTTITLKELKK